jgi:probable phosphoglycerate mutase
VLLVRHGETEWSRAGRHTSRTDLPLTAQGEADAARLRDRLAALLDGRSVTLALTSPLRRAVGTARLAGLDAAFQPDLAEWDYGRYEGLTTEEIQRERPGWTVWTGGCPGGETLEQVAARADRVIARVRAEADPGEGSDGVVVLVGHGHLLRVLAARWLGAPPEVGGWLALGAGSLSELGWEHDAPVVVRWNLD